MLKKCHLLISRNTSINSKEIISYVESVRSRDYCHFQNKTQRIAFVLNYIRDGYESQFGKVAKWCMCVCLRGATVINTCFHLDLIIIWVCFSLCIHNEWYSFRLFSVYHSSFLPFVLCLFFVYLHIHLLPFTSNRISDTKGMSLVKNSD